VPLDELNVSHGIRNKQGTGNPAAKKEKPLVFWRAAARVSGIREGRDGPNLFTPSEKVWRGGPHNSETKDLSCRRGMQQEGAKESQLWVAIQNKWEEGMDLRK